MNNEKGVTLIALIIYVITMTLVVAGVSAVTTSLYGAMNDYDTSAGSAVSFSKLNMYLLKDIKADKVSIYGAVSDNSFQLKLGDSEFVQYTVKNNALYRNKVKICSGIGDAKFEGGRDTITITLTINNYTKTTKYILEPAIA